MAVVGHGPLHVGLLVKTYQGVKGIILGSPLSFIPFQSDHSIPFDFFLVKNTVTAPRNDVCTWLTLWHHLGTWKLSECGGERSYPGQKPPKAFDQRGGVLLSPDQ